MNDLSIRAARIQVRALIAALIVAISIAIGITTGAFVLSFAVQRDLALQAGIPHYLTWIFPAIVDGAILGATIAVVALSKISGRATGKRFFLWLAVVVVFISVFGNAYHARRAGEEATRNVAAGMDLGFTPLTPTGASLIAIIPPLLVLAFTHGVGILIKAIGTAHTEYNALCNDIAGRAAEERESSGAVSTRLNQQVPDPKVQDRFNSINSIAGNASNTGIDIDVDAAETQVAGVRTSRDATSDDIAEAWPTGVDRCDGEDDVVAEVVADDLDVACNGTATAVPETLVLPDELQTTEYLLAFIESSKLDPMVKETARLKIEHPEATFAALAEATGEKWASTALRRYNKAKDLAVDAGFRTPPLPLTDEATDNGSDESESTPYEMVGAR
ncbi:putative membrane protein [Rhodococcus opacus M213]|uniref:Putative membrane protein n=1 Tax=Rhodococcus opacus M213 TaxID=1129896 RepID=K8XTY9_RHOOP|nr:DUF2637 domain-containing protein [Rhodococcus opacus]EKT80510.1 putative membrane protein [Rhodococcus opacus M213]